jgi:hypothetical protein
MFSLVLYVGGCLVVAAIVTLVHSMLRPIHSKGESKSWRVLFAVFVVCVSGPYCYVEVLTRSVGKPMKKAVEEGFADSGIRGDIEYYKVMSYSGDKARVIAVGLERQEWGGTDRPVIAMTLTKKGNDWEPQSFDVLFSTRLSKDRGTLPPYW